jgi:hypothetical protein
MKYDFDEVQDTISLRSVPAGVHICAIREVREGLSRDGSPRWSMKLEVLDGEHAGHHAAWDSITWSERGIHRVRSVLGVLGFNVEGELEVNSTDLVGKEARVRLVEEVYEDPLLGSRREQLVVPYNGWAKVEADPDSESTGSNQSAPGEPDPF